VTVYKSARPTPGDTVTPTEDVTPTVTVTDTVTVTPSGPSPTSSEVVCCDERAFRLDTKTLSLQFKSVGAVIFSAYNPLRLQVKDRRGLGLLSIWVLLGGMIRKVGDI
jgi:hypothetical protein